LQLLQLRVRNAYDERRPENMVFAGLSDGLNDEWVKYQSQSDTPLASCGDTRRPDIILIHAERRVTVVVECDEGSHRGIKYDSRCEMTKILTHAQSALATRGIERVCVSFGSTQTHIGVFTEV